MRCSTPPGPPPFRYHFRLSFLPITSSLSASERFWNIVKVLSPAPLPRKPVPFDEEWPKYRPTYFSAYVKAYNAERHAVEQVEANPTNKEAEQNVISARIAGYLLVELFRRRTILSDGPCVSLVKQLISPPREPEDTDHDLVFRIGKWHREYFLRLCTFDFFPMPFGISIDDGRR